MSSVKQELVRDDTGGNVSSSSINMACIEEIQELVKTKYPELYLARLEIWDEDGRQKRTTLLRYSQWLDRKKNQIKEDGSEKL